MAKRIIASGGGMYIADWLADDPDLSDRIPGLPMLGVIVGGSLSILIWTVISLSAWVIFVH